jgi:segregation and condensation protein B
MSVSARKDSGVFAAAAALSVPAAQIEAVLFLASAPVPEDELKTVLGLSGREITAALEELGEHLAAKMHGIVLRSAAGGWVLETNPHFAEVLSLFRDTARKRFIRLSKAAVETLAVVSYNQPVTRSEIEDLRGVRCERVIERLLSLGLIQVRGRKKTSGSPLLYRTTDRFLDLFGLEAIADLPTLAELEELSAVPVESLDTESLDTESLDMESLDTESLGSEGLDTADGEDAEEPGDAP